MPRPRLCRRIFFEPWVRYFKPAGVRLLAMQENVITFDELEAIRLKDLLGLDQEEAAKKMKISQPTFHRLLCSARKKIADALVNGKAIRIEGGVYEMVAPRQGRRGIGRGMGRGRRGFGRPAITCICPACGYKEEKPLGVPCASLRCPKCGAPMVRGE